MPRKTDAEVRATFERSEELAKLVAMVAEAELGDVVVEGTTGRITMTNEVVSTLLERITSIGGGQAFIRALEKTDHYG